MEDNDAIMFAGAAGTTLATVLIFCLIFIGALITKPLWLRYEHETFQSSHQYSESRIDELQIYASDWYALEAQKIQAESADNSELANSLQLQMSALEDQMRRSAESLSQNDIPTSVLHIIEQ